MKSQKRVVITRFGGPDVLAVEDAPIPTPGAGEVRLEVLATTASFTDTMIRSGNYPAVREKPPFSPGYDLVGRVDMLGPGVTGLSVGQRVADLTVFGANQQFVCCPAKGLVPVPNGLDDAEAVTLILSYLTAYQMMKRVARVKAGQRILVHAAGRRGRHGSLPARATHGAGRCWYGQRCKTRLCEELGCGAHRLSN